MASPAALTAEQVIATLRAHATELRQAGIRHAAVCLADILDNIGRIRSYVSTMDRAEFEHDGRTRDAVDMARGAGSVTCAGSRCAPGAHCHAWGP